MDSRWAFVAIAAVVAALLLTLLLKGRERVGTAAPTQAPVPPMSAAAAPPTAPSAEPLVAQAPLPIIANVPPRLPPASDPGRVRCGSEICDLGLQHCCMGPMSSSYALHEAGPFAAPREAPSCRS